MTTKTMYCVPSTLIGALCNALRVAGQQFEEDARLAEMNAAGLNEGPLRVAAQFKLQAKQCRELSVIFDRADGSRVFVEFLRAGFAPNPEDCLW